MKLILKNMNENLVTHILNWKYEIPYDFYNNELNDEEMNEWLDGSYHALINKSGEVFGFFCIGEAAQIPIGKQYGVYNENFVDMGLGMNPDYVGKGHGYDFCSFIINYIKANYKGTPIRLSVATFNQRAIHLYVNLGFVKKDKFRADFAEFMTMIKED